MNRIAISLKEYEEAERELLLRQRMHRWHRHGVVFALVGAVLLLIDVLASDPWWPDVLLLVVWAGVLFIHYRWARDYGDVHVREQQIRAEWRAGHSKEELAQK
jgi:hypothetical protein